MGKRMLMSGLLVLMVAGVAIYLSARPDATQRLPGRLGGQKSGEREALSAARQFLTDYVDPDGRVVRRDQQGDTVSEGQAYAMLLAVAVGDREAFELSWRWAKDNLQREDGLLSWLWKAGDVSDLQAASDADLDAARALLLAARRFEHVEYKNEALDLAKAILEHQTVEGKGGRLLVAGPWATEDPYVVNPSYFSPGAYSEIEKASSDERWKEVRDVSRYVLGKLNPKAPFLPSDWAEVDADGAVSPTGPPGSSDDPKYGWDAVRAVIKMAEDCDEFGQKYSASLWPFFKQNEESVMAVYELDGKPDVDYESAIGYVAAAAAADAAGQEKARDTLLAKAQTLNRESPTYYGSAWLALGRIMLTTDLLRSC